MPVPYRITSSGLELLKQGGNASVEADWVRCLSFEHDPVTGNPVLAAGPAAGPVEMLLDGSGNPLLRMTGGAGSTQVSPALQRSTGGVYVVPVTGKDFTISFGVTFQAVPGVVFSLDTIVSTAPTIHSVTTTQFAMTFAQNYVAGSKIQWVAIEPAS